MLVSRFSPAWDPWKAFHGVDQSMGHSQQHVLIGNQATNVFRLNSRHKFPPQYECMHFDMRLSVMLPMQFFEEKRRPQFGLKGPSPTRFAVSIRECSRMLSDLLCVVAPPLSIILQPIQTARFWVHCHRALVLVCCCFGSHFNTIAFPAFILRHLRVSGKKNYY